MIGRARCTDFRALAISLGFTSAFCGVCLDEAWANDVHVIGVDNDDDDVDGRMDSTQELVSLSDELFEVPVAPGKDRSIVIRGSAVRVLVDGKPSREPQVPVGARRVTVQGVRAGRAEVDLSGRTHRFAVAEMWLMDGQDRHIESSKSHASFQRLPPDRLGNNPYGRTSDSDALRFILIAPRDDLPPIVRLTTRDPSGGATDSLESVTMGSVPCPLETSPELACGSTVPIRLVPDEIDRNHPTTVERSLRASLGGAVELALPMSGRQLGSVRVGGPRHTSIGPIVRYRGRLRVFLVRPTVGGPPPIGSDDVGALALARSEVAQASALWAACGIGFGPPSDLEATVVDPPRTHLIALGCGQAMASATNGRIHLKVDGHDISVPIDSNVTPAGAARVLASAIVKAGFVARVSDNPAIGATSLGTSDVIVRRRTGELALVEPPASGPLMTDPWLTVCLGRVDLEDGLQHFGDVDAIAGTIEERALIKAFDDGDPATIEVFVIPSFASGGRIGESFIGADGGSVRNVLIEDRAALRADRASFALAHELGHVLLDEPGHPDDFGRDTPSRLMDADATNGTAFGPRRLLVDECVRALRQSGPSATVPLLRPWPLAPIGNDR
jgi:hypothetical protein